MMAAGSAEITLTADSSQAIDAIDRTSEALRGVTESAESVREALDAFGRSPRVSVLSEPLTYDVRLARDPRGPRGFRAISVQDGKRYSYVKDVTLATLRRGNWEASAARLERHEREMRVLAEERERIFSPDVNLEFERRAVNWTNGQGGYFAPPAWIVDHYATVPTPERVLSAACPSFDLPDGVQSVNLPRWTAGAEVGNAQVGSASVDVDLLDQAVQSAVATIAGSADVPMQMLEQSAVGAHLDWMCFTNMEARYGYQLELQMLNGAGAATPQGSGNNQILGLLQNSAVPTANQVTYTDSTPTVTEMIQTSGQGGPLPQAIAAIGNNRKVKPEMWMMTTSRGAWITSGEVTFPLALANQEGPGSFDLLAYPVRQNDAIPTTLVSSGQTSAKEDRIIACRPSDWILLESDRRTGVYTDTLSGTMMARIQMRRYVAALLRQPTSVAWLQGSGMIVPTGF